MPSPKLTANELTYLADVIKRRHDPEFWNDSAIDRLERKLLELANEQRSLRK